MLTPVEAPKVRKSLPRAIYEPKGKAGEYARLACNLGLGCPHACRYCYVTASPAWRVSGRPQGDFGRFVPKEHILEALEADCARLARKGDPGPVFFSFTHDPFAMPVVDLMRKAVGILAKHGIGANVLTKGVLTPMDIQLLKRLPRAEVGITLTDTVDWKGWEPNAPQPQTRRANLRMAKQAGLSTWVSCEPILGVEELLGCVHDTLPWADRYALGRLNHHPKADKINHRLAITKAVELLERAGKPYTIKEGSR